MPKASHEVACRRASGKFNVGYTLTDQKNHLRTKRQREMAYGQAGSMLKFFRDKIAENPSFQYHLQLDCEEHIANIFWVDAKMLLDYAHFGDVVTFDTTFGTNKEYRPFGIFLGLNQFRETTIFGAALMFDETRDSYIWLFETFLAAHNGRQPRTIYINQDAAMGGAIEKVFTESYHGLCTFHIMQNDVKHLTQVGVEDEEKEPHILTDFGACMYGYEDKAAFEEAFDNMRLKVHKQTWLDSIYKVKEKWVECYMRDVFSLGVRSTQLSESFNNALKNHLKSDFHILRFLMHFERTVEVKRTKELESEFNARKYIPRIKMFTPMLVEASKVYTSIIFEAFQGEYERSMAACCRVLDGNNRFVVAIASLHGDLEFEEERIVIGDPLTKTVSCSCGMFNRTGILCGHGLKVLDLMNIKTLPTHYVLKRWTREARNGSIEDKEGRKVVENPKLEAQLRYRDLSHQFHNVAHRAASSPQCCLLLANALASVAPSIQEILNATSAMYEPYKDKENVDPNVQQIDELLRAARLKKKEVPATKLRRKQTWLDKLLKGKRIPLKSTAPTKTGENPKKKKDGVQKKKDGVQKKKKDGVQQKKDDVQPQVLVEKCDNTKGVNMESQECNAIMSFTQLLMAPPL
ncbi:protein FAR1-RELATED SEQUENCE 5 isoform X1 [Aegilops tauschii subsp. strangulata]